MVFDQRWQRSWAAQNRLEQWGGDERVYRAGERDRRKQYRCQFLCLCVQVFSNLLRVIDSASVREVEAGGVMDAMANVKIIGLLCELTDPLLRGRLV
jgi:hypothetical protein